MLWSSFFKNVIMSKNLVLTVTLCMQYVVTEFRGGKIVYILKIKVSIKIMELNILTQHPYLVNVYNYNYKLCIGLRVVRF